MKFKFCPVCGSSKVSASSRWHKFEYCDKELKTRITIYACGSCCFEWYDEFGTKAIDAAIQKHIESTKAGDGE